MYIQVSPLSPVTLMTDYLARMNTALKGTAGLRDVNGLISLKAILKYRHGSFAQVDNLPPIPHGRPRRIDNRNSVASNNRKFIAENSTSNPFRGRILVQARAKHQARLNALPSAAENQRS